MFGHVGTLGDGMHPLGKVGVKLSDQLYTVVGGNLVQRGAIRRIFVCRLP